jgi:hypothetical protein
MVIDQGFFRFLRVEVEHICIAPELDIAVGDVQGVSAYLEHEKRNTIFVSGRPQAWSNVMPRDRDASAEMVSRRKCFNHRCRHRASRFSMSLL